MPSIGFVTMNKRYQLLTSKLLLDELGDGRLIVLGEDADEIDSSGQAVNVEGVQLFRLSVAAHDLATAQVVDHDLLPPARSPCGGHQDRTCTQWSYIPPGAHCGWSVLSARLCQ